MNYIKRLLKRYGLILVGALFSVSAFGQQINYRLGAVWGQPEPYAVVGVSWFELAPNSGLFAEAVTFTPLQGVSQEVPAYAGVGVMREWVQPAGWAVSAGVSFVVEVGNGWERIDQVRAAGSVGVRF